MADDIEELEEDLLVEPDPEDIDEDEIEEDDIEADLDVVLADDLLDDDEDEDDDDFEDDGEEPAGEDHDEETAEALEELESEELALLDDEAAESLLVDEVEELRAIRREELTLNVEAQAPKTGEFVCQSCFLVKRTSQLANRKKMLCTDCVS